MIFFWDEKITTVSVFFLFDEAFSDFLAFLLQFLGSEIFLIVVHDLLKEE